MSMLIEGLRVRPPFGRAGRKFSKSLYEIAKAVSFPLKWLVNVSRFLPNRRRSAQDWREWRRIVATMRSRRLRSYTVVGSPVGRNSSGQPWFARFVIGLIMLAALVWLTGLFGQRALGEGWFEAVDVFTIEADADHWLTSFFVAITWLGTLTGVVVVSLIMLLTLLLLKRYRGAAAFLVSLLTAAYTNDFLKEWVARDRPIHEGIVEAGGFSYLSGHAFISAAVYGLFAYLLVRKVESAGLRWILGAFAVVFIGLIGFSRIYLGVHYTSDVIGGFVLGIVWMLVWLTVFRPFGVKTERW